MTTDVSTVGSQIADREAVRECICRYCRGVDRLDADMVRSALWPDAVDKHLDSTGDTEAFIAWSFPRMAAMDQAQHFVCNVLTAVGRSSAEAEVYFLGFHRVNAAAGKSDMIAGGRYVLRFERREDEWRISERLIVTDWFRQFANSADWSRGMVGFMIEPGGRMPTDESYRRIRIE